MVRHIVWWTLKPEAEGRTAAENAKLIKQRLEALMGQIPSLKSLEVSYDFLPTCTMPVNVILMTTHDDAEGLKAYAEHPAHVAVGKELERALELCVQVVLADAGRHADLLDLHDALILLGFLFTLGLLKTVFAVVHDLAHGGNGVGRDLHKVELLLLCLGQCLLCGDDAEHGAVRCDQANLLIPDLLIELMI